MIIVLCQLLNDPLANDGTTLCISPLCRNGNCSMLQTSRVLYNQPDFVAVESNLERICKARGFSVLFLPKFHCELNFIEQCWGYAKRIYRQYPTSSKEVDLERNVLSALESVPLDSMRRFSTRACRFMDAYHKGLNGKQAAWASKKYRGHRVLPDSILHDLDGAHV
ncbi:hypothetical protein F4604DRAFT_1623007 [Suillus subluteus]|nr:hypothetical protein F4604DRAFT_1636483 [Suillus subluteus]KAG1847218.1 hypothetical protein F4604DRAFT_1630688 [Suillus subluteus]KAG1873204.1 hypothetical protein F4604DRAFT_1623007 [Suillus subluteus]